MSNNFADVEKEYEKYPELKREDIKILQEWSLKQPHLPEINELKMIIFLSSCCYNIEATKKCIENYYTIRTHYPPIFQDRNLDEKSFQDAMKAVCVNPIRVESSSNKHVMLFVHDSNLDLVHVDHFIAIADIATDLLYMKEGASKGHVVILDGSNVRLALAMKINLTSIKVLLQYSQIALPICLKELHVVNVSAGLEKIFALCKPFLGKELAKLIHIHTNVEDLQKYIPVESIPKDLGGCGPSYEMLHGDEMVQTLMDHKEYVKKDALNHTDETKRLGTPLNIGDLFGFEGTFKKLEID